MFTGHIDTRDTHTHDTREHTQIHGNRNTETRDSPTDTLEHTHTHPYRYTNTPTQIHRHTHTRAQTRTQTRTRTHTHTRGQSHTHAHTQIQWERHTIHRCMGQAPRHASQWRLYLSDSAISSSHQSAKRPDVIVRGFEVSQCECAVGTADIMALGDSVGDCVIHVP